MSSRSLRTHPLVSREHFMDSYATEYHASEGVRPLDAHDIFSFHDTVTLGTPAFASLHVLGLLTHYRGSLENVPSQNTLPTRYRGAVQSDFLSASFIASLQDTLGLTFGRGTMRKFGRAGGSYARLLALLGFPTSDGSSHCGRERNCKAVRDITLPGYLTSLITKYASLSVGEQRLARSYLRDFVNTFLFTRRLERKTLAYEASLFSQPSVDALHAQATPLCQTLALLYPSAFQGLTSTETLKHHRTLFHAHTSLYGADFVLPIERLVRLPLNHDLCMKLGVHPRDPQYYYMNRACHLV